MGFLYSPFFKNPIIVVALESALPKGDCYIGRDALHSYRYWAHELRKLNFGSFDKEEPQVSKSYLIGQGRAGLEVSRLLITSAPLTLRFCRYRA